jgi:AraC-like DNA-binding protein
MKPAGSGATAHLKQRNCSSRHCNESATTTTHQLLQAIAERLAQQTVELERIRQEVTLANRLLASILQAVTSTARSCTLLAAATRQYLSSLTAARLAHELEGTLHSTRVLMLCSLCLLAAAGTRPAYHSQCSPHHNPWSKVLRSLATSWTGLLPTAAQQQAHPGAAWVGVTLVPGWCALRFAGEHRRGDAACVVVAASLLDSRSPCVCCCARSSPMRGPAGAGALDDVCLQATAAARRGSRTCRPREQR